MCVRGLFSKQLSVGNSWSCVFSTTFLTCNWVSVALHQRQVEPSVYLVARIFVSLHDSILKHISFFFLLCPWLFHLLEVVWLYACIPEWKSEWHYIALFWFIDHRLFFARRLCPPFVRHCSLWHASWRHCSWCYLFIVLALNNFDGSDGVVWSCCFNRLYINFTNSVSCRLFTIFKRLATVKWFPFIGCLQF